jgi:hypothetical protein
LGRLNFERAPPKLQRAIKSKEIRDREKAQEGKGKEWGWRGRGQRAPRKNKFRGSLNFLAEASADQKSNLCIGQPKIIFLVGAL